nr:MAG TPA: hypothetical protein [Caudoviricetes sp.]DAZ07068.1 MAG TPA: hypothetical protein [Caudoviricetes sp.]DAZ51396.1 MAG TPA: hypothetical protein [Caudoviricetes sp.]
MYSVVDCSPKGTPLISPRVTEIPSWDLFVNSTSITVNLASL